MAQLRGLSVMAVLAVAAMLTACGSQSNTGAARTSSSAALPSGSSSGTPSPSPSPPGSSSPAPRNGQSTLPVVHLTAGFSPGKVWLRARQQFLLIVSNNVTASGLADPGPCPAGTVRPVAGGLLTAQCMAGSRYLFTANGTGTATMTATVKPRCAPASVCPQWVTEPSLTVIIR